MNSPKTLIFKCPEIMHDMGHYSALLDLLLGHLVDVLRLTQVLFSLHQKHPLPLGHRLKISSSSNPTGGSE